jgi:hypothetical protein
MNTQVFESGHDTRIIVTNKEIARYGMHIECAYKNVNPNELLFDKEYQRTIETARIRKISASIQKYGYWPQEVIIVTKDMRVIDGQHRAKSAIAEGLIKVPVSIVTFPTREKEAEFFAAKNNWNTSLKPIDYWFARYLAGELTAEYIYKLESDPESLLYKKIALKGRETDATKFNLNNVIMMMNTIYGRTEPWKKDIDEFLRDSLRKSGYMEVKLNLNKFLKWFYGIWGNSKLQNPIPYRKDSIRAICAFYNLLIKHEFEPEKAVNKMQSFVSTADFIRATMAGKVQALVVHFNHGKQKKLVNDLEV